MATASFLNDLISRTHCNFFMCFRIAIEILKPTLLVPSLETCLSVLFLFPFNFNCKFVQPIMPQFLLKWTLCDLKTNKEFQTNSASNAPKSFCKANLRFYTWYLTNRTIFVYYLNFVTSKLYLYIIKTLYATIFLCILLKSNF